MDFKMGGNHSSASLPSHGIPPPPSRPCSFTVDNLVERARGKVFTFPLYFFNFIFNFMTLPTTKKKKKYSRSLLILPFFELRL